ncbi:hypothetical protein BDF20DRAFT_901727 [Mycotypha africana]|uniref:uncharacterized protein n=1 Tax=Mycotypha africana TaxID=64632 RepID=UPI002300899E|nr:uncharacterized protein BDF20DRAFT_901727 [Mycotypha africana]KAI8967299.1 hypothetical protein BDF20DRAFT_901727 [Mycotypha africana]
MSDPLHIKDDTLVSTVLQHIGQEKNWSSQDVEKDLEVLNRNRLFYIRDLKSLSGDSWNQIELLPLVKDLLRNAIDPCWPPKCKHTKHKKERRKKV